MSRLRGVVAMATAGAVTVLSVAACFSDRQGGLTGLPQDCADIARAAGVPSNHTVIGMVNHTFVPAQVTIPRGGTVTWVNCETGAQHTATARDNSWNSGLFAKGQTFSRTFPTPGENEFYCIPHPVTMQGKVVVQ